MERGATFDPTGTYRYSLTRGWNASRPPCVFILLNPSTANATVDDPTIRRCIGFARDWGYGSLEVVNLFALRATNPRQLRLSLDPVGEKNDEHIARAVKSASRVVAGWGIHGSLRGRDRAVLRMLRSTEVVCLGTTEGGHPRHPLYVRRVTEPVGL